MRTGAILLVVALAGASGIVAALVGGGSQSNGPDAVVPTQLMKPKLPMTEPVTARTSAAEGAVESPTEPRSAPATEDPRLADLEAEVARLRGELEACRFPEGTPYGAFIRSPEAAPMSEAGRKKVHEVLDSFPVVLSPGEATWIAEFEPLQSWTDEMVQFLGARRIRSQATPAQLAKLRSTLGDERFEELFRQ